MTEPEWLASGDVEKMLAWVGAPFPGGVSGTGGGRPYSLRLTDRKYRLFAVACCRDNWGLLDGEARSQVDYADSSADDPTISQVNLRACWMAHWRSTVGDDMRRHQEGPGWDCLHQQPHVAAVEVVRSTAALVDVFARVHGDAGGAKAAMRRFADLLRDVAGNPFLEVMPLSGEPNQGRDFRKRHALALSSFAVFSDDWRTPTVTSLAEYAYEERDFAGLPVLADALEDAGCDCEPLLTHLRSPGPHVRGCWSLDCITRRD